MLEGVLCSDILTIFFSNFAGLSYILSLSLKDIEILFASFFAPRFGTIALVRSLIWDQGLRLCLIMARFSSSARKFGWLADCGIFSSHAYRNQMPEDGTMEEAPRVCAFRQPRRDCCQTRETNRILVEKSPTHQRASPYIP